MRVLTITKCSATLMIETLPVVADFKISMFLYTVFWSFDQYNLARGNHSGATHQEKRGVVQVPQTFAIERATTLKLGGAQQSTSPAR